MTVKTVRAVERRSAAFVEPRFGGEFVVRVYRAVNGQIQPPEYIDFAVFAHIVVRITRRIKLEVRRFLHIAQDRRRAQIAADVYIVRVDVKIANVFH